MSLDEKVCLFDNPSGEYQVKAVPVKYIKEAVEGAKKDLKEGGTMFESYKEYCEFVEKIWKERFGDLK